VFQAELQGTSETKPGVSFGSGGLLAMFGDVEESPRSSQALGQLTLDAERPGSMLASIERAREGARTVRDVDQRRDVGGDQHDRPRPARAADSRAGPPQPDRISRPST